MSLQTSLDIPSPRHASFLEASALPQEEVPKKITLPWVRESTFGRALGVRTAALVKTTSSYSPGPADLVHWGRHYGERSSKFNQSEFASPKQNGHQSKEEDGYVGYYHFCNGIDYLKGAAAVEEYILGAIGLGKAENGYLWLADTDPSAYGTYLNKQMVVTLCVYNVFSRQELRARYIISVPKSKRTLVSVDALYVVHSQVLKKLHTFTGTSVGDLQSAFWNELAVLSIVRLCLNGDDPARQLTGTVNLAAQVQSKSALLEAIDRIVSLLPRGHFAGMRECFGVSTACGTDTLKTSRYRNFLVDTLVRIVLFDLSGSAVEHAIEEIHARYDAGEFDVVECQLLKAHLGSNCDQRFLSLVHTHLSLDPRLTQSALLLIEQVRFLLAKGSYATATKLAARAVSLLPLDFDCWYHLALCYVLSKKYDVALVTINSFPVIFSRTNIDDSVDGVVDDYAITFMERAVRGKSIDLRNFESFFPAPLTEDGSIKKLWHTLYQYNPHLRHPTTGPFFQSPLISATPLEISAVDSSVMKVCAPSARKYIYASQSALLPWPSVLDFDRKSTWGRTYDLLTLIVASIGWDNLVHSKAKAFRSDTVSKDYALDENASRPECEAWLLLLFMVIYEDIRVMVLVSNQDHDRSALAWEMIGFTGWSCKYNLKDSISSLVTSVAGVAADGGFDYFGTVKLLEIYDEFVLSDVASSTIDLLSSPYDHRSYTNKLIVQTMSPRIHQEFVNQLKEGYFALENILLYLTRLVSWNLRWYNYMPSYLVTNTLVKLCIKFDSVHVRATLRVVFENNKKQIAKATGNFTLRSMFAAPPKEETVYEFTEQDTVIDYMNRILAWIELLQD